MARKTKVITDAAKIDELLTRSVDSIYPTKDNLKKELLSGKQLRVYVGIDPTATYVHLGHATNYFLLKRLHELGHKIIVLIGDFTAMIGDPSDKTAARVRLTKKDVKENLKTFKKQIGKILDFEDKENPIEFQFNSKWLAKLSFEDVAELASHFTVQQMIQRDTFERRLKEQKPLYVHEFFYPLMQGYDSVALEADLEIGGTDQTFNMLAGRTLVSKIQGREKYVLTTTLLENPKTGEKLMSKSQGTGIGLDESPKDMYAKALRLPDEGIIQCFIDCTELPMNEIRAIQNKLALGENPKEAKMRLAFEIVSMFHSKKDAQKAQEEFQSVFAEKEIPTDIKEIHVDDIVELEDVVHEHKLLQSKSEFRRLIQGGGVRDMETGEKILDPKKRILIPLTLKLGKKNFIRIIVRKKKK